jgi:hypothetical protein
VFKKQEINDYYHVPHKIETLSKKEIINEKEVYNE